MKGNTQLSAICHGTLRAGAYVMLRQAFRSLSANRGYSFTAISTLAIALAAMATIFAVVRTVIIDPLPFNKANQIVVISQIVPGLFPGPTVATIGEVQAWKQTGLFQSLAALNSVEDTLTGEGRAERIQGVTASADLFRVFDVQPLIGRSLQEQDATPGHNNVVVLSHSLWVRKFYSRHDILGKSVKLSDRPVTVIGVMPPRFDFPRLADVSSIMSWAPEHSEYWTPLFVNQQMIDNGDFNYFVVGRIRPGIAMPQAAAQLRAAAAAHFRSILLRQPAYQELGNKMIRTFSVNVAPLKQTMSWGVRDALWMLLAAIACLLLLVLFNLGSLLLTQTANRLRELSIRQTLGASRWQLFNQSLLEQALVIGIATVLGVFVASWSIHLIQLTWAERLPRLNDLTFSTWDVALVVVLFALTSLTLGICSQLFLPPATAHARSLSESRNTTSSRSTTRLKDVLMVGQIALSVILIVGSGLLMHSFANVMRVNPGFDPHHILSIEIAFNPKKTDTPTKRLSHMRDLLANLRGIPGVQSASIVNRLPLTGDTEIRTMKAVGQPLNKTPEDNSAEYRVASESYFETMKIPLLAGRSFRADERANLTVINDRMAKRMFPGESAIGKQISDLDGHSFDVIGVVGDVHNGALEREPMMQFYRLPIANPYYPNTIVIRSSVDASSLERVVQNLIQRNDPNEPLTHSQTMDALLSSMTLNRKFQTALITAFAGIALLLSALGIFGTASLSVARRYRELGIRLALGATSLQVLRSEVLRTLLLVAIGLTMGLVLSISLAKLSVGLLFGVHPWNPVIYLAAAIILASCSLLAVSIPARRAARIDPATILRSE